MSCIAVLYIALARCTAGRSRRRCRRVDARAARDGGSRRALRAPRRPGERAAGRSDLGSAPAARTRRTSIRRGSWRAPATGSADTRPTKSAGRCSNAASPRRARRSRWSRTVRRATSGSPPTWARWPSRSACARGSSTAATIKDELLTVLRLDPGVPAGIGGPRARPLVLQGARAVRRQQQEVGRAPARSLTYSPESTASHFFLAEVLIATKRNPEAQTVLQKLMASPGEPGWGPENHEYQGQGSAAARQAEVGRMRSQTTILSEPEV